MLASSLPSFQDGGKGRKGQSRQIAGSQKPNHVGAICWCSSLFRAGCIPPLWDSVNPVRAETRALLLWAEGDGVWQHGCLAECWAQCDCRAQAPGGRWGGQQAGTGQVHKQIRRDAEWARESCVEQCRSGGGSGEDGFLRGTFPGTSMHCVL